MQRTPRCVQGGGDAKECYLQQDTECFAFVWRDALMSGGHYGGAPEKKNNTARFQLRVEVAEET